MLLRRNLSINNHFTMLGPTYLLQRDLLQLIQARRQGS
jgi:hypothetical protein